MASRHLKPGAWFFAMLLAFALLLAQTLGLMHGVMHGNGNGNGNGNANHAKQHSPDSVAHLDANDHADHADHDDGLAALFSTHDTEPDCRLYDQAGHGGAAPAVVSINLPAVLPSPLVAIFHGEALARWAALFDARGPPLTL